MDSIFEGKGSPTLDCVIESLLFVRAVKKRRDPGSVVGKTAMEIDPPAVTSLVNVTSCPTDGAWSGLNFTTGNLSLKVAVAAHRRRRRIDIDRDMLQPPCPRLPEPGSCHAAGAIVAAPASPIRRARGKIGSSPTISASPARGPSPASRSKLLSNSSAMVAS
jgi:hypothetical protein